MPNRILRDWTDSFAVDLLDAHAERFFVRLIMVVDDYGRYHADPRMLRAKCFPLKTDVRDTDITRWLAECEKAGMVRCYQDGKGRNLLEIAGFKQRSRTDSKFQAPPDGPLPLDGQMTVKSQTNDGLDVFVFGDVDVDGARRAYPFPSDEFFNVWMKWKAYSRSVGKVVNEIVQSQQWQMLKPLGEARAIAMIENTIANGWKNLREKEAEPPAGSRKQPKSNELSI